MQDKIHLSLVLTEAVLMLAVQYVIRWDLVPRYESQFRCSCLIKKSDIVAAISWLLISAQ